jgi:uncharacterized membrane protein
MSILAPAFLIGIVCGLRAMTGPAVVSWAAYLGWLHLDKTPLAFLGYAWTPWIVGLLAVAELVADQLPTTPSRRAPGPFIVRIVTGAFCGAALGLPGSAWIIGLALGAVGGVVGTLGGYELRTRLTQAIGGNDHPIAVLEDIVAIGGGLLIVKFL